MGDMFKTLMWPFLKVDLNSLHETSSTVKSIKSAPVYARLHFHKETPTFDLTIERPMEKLQFGQIRLPYGLHMVLPLKGDLITSAKSAANLISANTLLPVCKVEGKALLTFDNRSHPLTMDPCFHVVAADCSIHGKFAVQARELASGQKDICAAFAATSTCSSKTTFKDPRLACTASPRLRPPPTGSPTVLLDVKL